MTEQQSYGWLEEARARPQTLSLADLPRWLKQYADALRQEIDCNHENESV